MMLRAVLLVLALAGAALACGLPPPAAAQQTIRTADQPLADPALEARARALMREIRCVVCQSQSIDESDADIAANLRNIVREQIAAGKSEAEIRDYLVARYGDFVLMKPPFNRATLVLWVAPFALALVALAAVAFGWRRRAGAVAAARDLSGAERARLNQMLSEHADPGGGRP
ncbi:MAG TPA: cytochrome c-type biogenesis protein [Dongiaceae bacterium]|nr:cytochrome c-type biogenesis protein [Dongiaceae bacterium]